jgi:4-hydroxymandelate oxidase
VEELSWMDDLAFAARDKLPEATYDFVAAGAGLERTVLDNRAHWAELAIVPRALRGVAAADTATSIPGAEVRSPILLAPAGRQRALHREGEVASARAAHEFGSIFTLATSATTDLHDLASVASSCWLQLYVSTDRDWTELVVTEAEKVGFGQIIVTVDRAREAHRPRSARHGGLGGLPPGVEVTSHRGDGSTRSSEPGEWDPTLSWADIEWIRSLTSIPIGVKGVLRADDARRAEDAGVSTIIVSNHGGRQIDGAISTARALPRIVDAVSNDIAVLVDGGIRSGGDVFRALAMGARAVLVGRPYLWALAVDGQQGVWNVLKRLTDELCEVMTLSGCGTLADITRDAVDR